MERETKHREAPTMEEFFSDRRDQFLCIGDLQVAGEAIRRLRRDGADEASVIFLEELIPRVENSLFLLLRLIEEQLDCRRTRSTID